MRYALTSASVHPGGSEDNAARSFDPSSYRNSVRTLKPMVFCLTHLDRSTYLSYKIPVQLDASALLPILRWRGTCMSCRGWGSIASTFYFKKLNYTAAFDKCLLISPIRSVVGTLIFANSKPRSNFFLFSFSSKSLVTFNTLRHFFTVQKTPQFLSPTEMKERKKDLFKPLGFTTRYTGIQRQYNE